MPIKADAGIVVIWSHLGAMKTSVELGGETEAWSQIWSLEPREGLSKAE